MNPFDSTEEAIQFGEDRRAGEFCCFIRWRDILYTASIQRTPTGEVYISLHLKK